MGSLLGSIFGEGSATQGDTFADRLRAQYAPGAYQAHQQNQQQQAIYSAMLQNGASPAQAQMLAASPQAFQAGQGAYMPAAPQVQTYTNSAGEQIPVQIQNPGGRAGHGLSLSGIPITAPGTTANPTQAAGGQEATQVGEQTQNAPAASAGPTNTLQGMPGSTAQTLQMIDKAREAGVSGEELLKQVPREFRDLAEAVQSGKMTEKQLVEHRGVQTRNIVSKLVQAIDPDYSEAANEARNNYRTQYFSGKNTDVGGQVKSINKLAGHANAIADASLNMDNIGLGGSGLATPINKLGNYLYSTPGAGLKRASDLYTNELSSYLSGKGGSGVDERKERSQAFSPNQTPQAMGQALLTDIEFLEKQMQGNEQHRNQVFTNPKMQQQFPLVSPQALEQLNQAKVKAHKLVGDYDEWSKSEEGQKAGVSPKGAPVNAPNNLPNGWKLIK